MPRRAEMMAWDAAADATLRWHWAGPLSTLQIGEAMGLTKSAVIGRAHRLGLPARPSPIRGQRAEARPAARKKRSPPAPPVAPPAQSVAPPPAPPRVVTAPPPRSCQWIEGPARGAATVFCGAPARPASSYCEAHHARCVTPRVGPAAGAGGLGMGRTVGWPGA